MSHTEDGLRPEEFAEAAEAAIQDALTRADQDVPGILAAAGLLGVCAGEADGGLGLALNFAVPLAQAAGRLRLRFALAEQILLARHLAGTTFATALTQGQHCVASPARRWLGGPRAPRAGCTLAAGTPRTRGGFA